ncbi:hypothetical protein B0H14DRAFT_3506644 [Mycena olivaceomarginata]|nr:hypothetical protein B0H14DRAFT_3506644 [Mycena olivaceomarginata]
MSRKDAFWMMEVSCTPPDAERVNIEFISLQPSSKTGLPFPPFSLSTPPPADWSPFPLLPRFTKQTHPPPALPAQSTTIFFRCRRHPTTANGRHDTRLAAVAQPANAGEGTAIALRGWALRRARLHAKLVRGDTRVPTMSPRLTPISVHDVSLPATSTAMRVPAVLCSPHPHALRQRRPAPPPRRRYTRFPPVTFRYWTGLASHSLHPPHRTKAPLHFPPSLPCSINTLSPLRPATNAAYSLPQCTEPNVSLGQRALVSPGGYLVSGEVVELFYCPALYSGGSLPMPALCVRQHHLRLSPTALFPGRVTAASSLLPAPVSPQGPRASDFLSTASLPIPATLLLCPAAVSPRATLIHLPRARCLMLPAFACVVVAPCSRRVKRATARRHGMGGHCRPDCYRDYTHYRANFGWEQALKVIQNEMDMLNLMEEIIAKEGIDCDFWRGFTYAVHIAMDQPAADSLAASCADFVADGGPVEGLVTPILDSVEARKTTRCPAATAAYKSPAGSLFPRKLVLHLFTWRHGLNLQMRTPVRRVVPCTNNIGDTWEMETETVVYATNAYTATLLPEFVGHIWPFKGQCAAAVPPEAYVRPNMLRETYVLQPTDGVIIFGGQRKSVPVERLLGNTDDTQVDLEMVAALREALLRHFEGWGENSTKSAYPAPRARLLPTCAPRAIPAEHHKRKAGKSGRDNAGEEGTSAQLLPRCATLSLALLVRVDSSVQGRSPAAAQPAHHNSWMPPNPHSCPWLSGSAPMVATLALCTLTALTGRAYFMHTAIVLLHVPPKSTAARICAQVASPRVRALRPPTSHPASLHTRAGFLLPHPSCPTIVSLLCPLRALAAAPLVPPVAAPCSSQPAVPPPRVRPTSSAHRSASVCVDTNA